MLPLRDDIKYLIRAVIEDEKRYPSSGNRDLSILKVSPKEMIEYLRELKYNMIYQKQDSVTSHKIIFQNSQEKVEMLVLEYSPLDFTIGFHLTEGVFGW